ncbi:hypothetical protein [Actinomyces sp. Z3]|uniref:hypothetical protein n=1 Tax=Actinomyces sp. Z3 TaxID=2250217 RepID=UPI000D58CCD1|nr:hypothetical protein [Actinomyces sp. Z3]RAX23304.1 hypothetical protein DRB07_04965 [Actinomyces sp. Z3]
MGHLAAALRGRLRRSLTGLLVLLLACGPLVACSSESDDNPLNIPTYDPEAAASAEASESAAAAEASASAAASAEAAGIVTAESLSTDRHVITSIPEDLDEQQTEVLKAFVNYDEVTWNIWFTGTGVENAEPLTTAEEYQIIENNYEASSGQTIEGTVRISVTEVFAMSPTEAQVLVCDDQSDLTSYDAAGQENTDPDYLRGRFEILVTFTNEGYGWLVSEEARLSTNECTVQ